MELDVYLGERRIAALTQAGQGGCELAYLPEAIEAPAGEAALSRSLPVRERPYGPAETRPYLEGLLPEGEWRRLIATELGIDSANTFALIAELGRDCIGAAVFLPRGEPLERRQPDDLDWLDEDEFEQLTTAPDQGLLDPAHARRMRFALPGERHKLALIRDEDGDRWAWPEPGAPSTHVVKPETDEERQLSFNRMACLASLRELGLPVVDAELDWIGEHPFLITRRFDRSGEGPGAERLHQETFSQALGLLPEGAGRRRASYRQSVELLREVGAESSIETVFAVAFCNHMFGNDDSVHGKRSALLHGPDGPVLAPYCDMSSAGAYQTPREQRSVFKLTRRDIDTDLAPSLIGRDHDLDPAVFAALETVSELAAAAQRVSNQAREEGWYAWVVGRILPSILDTLPTFLPPIGGSEGPGS